MKIDEAISILKQYIDYNNPDIPDFYTMEEACEVAIKALEQEPCDIQKLKVGDTVLVKCKVEAVFTNSQMVMVTTKDCDKGFDAYTDEIVCVCQDNIKQIKQEPCDDAVSRQAVAEVLLKYAHSTEGKAFAEFLVSQINDLPSVTPQQKMGHWEWVQYDSNPNIGNWHCSKCRTIIPHMPEETDNTPIYKWCPMCGCKMREVEG